MGSELVWNNLLPQHGCPDFPIHSQVIICTRCFQLPSRRVEFLNQSNKRQVLQQILLHSVSSLLYEAQVVGSLLCNVLARNR